MNINSYSSAFTPTETSEGGTVLYIANYVSRKCRNCLNIYKNNNWNLLKYIMGVIYRHPFMDLLKFNCNYLNKLLKNISREQKSVFLPGDFNVNLLNYNEHD